MGCRVPQHADRPNRYSREVPHGFDRQASTRERPPQLVVIRGNSASGKTSLAASLQEVLGPGTANIGQDHFRRVVLREHDVPNGANIGFIASSARHCVGLGYNVVLEGIFYTPHYRAMLSELIADHPGPVSVFWLEVPVEETVARHLSKPDATVSADTVRSWFNEMDLLGVPGEVIVDASGPPDEVLGTVADQVSPVRSQPDFDCARFV